MARTELVVVPGRERWSFHLTGRVYALAHASNGAIHPGDLVL